MSIIDDFKCRQDWGPGGYTFEVIEKPKDDPWVAFRQYCEEDVTITVKPDACVNQVGPEATSVDFREKYKDVYDYFVDIPFVEMPSGGSDGDAKFRFKDWSYDAESQAQDRTQREPAPFEVKSITVPETGIPERLNMGGVDVDPLDYSAIEARTAAFYEEYKKKAREAWNACRWDTCRYEK